MFGKDGIQCPYGMFVVFSKELLTCFPIVFCKRIVPGGIELVEKAVDTYCFGKQAEKIMCR